MKLILAGGLLVLSIGIFTCAYMIFRPSVTAPVSITLGNSTIRVSLAKTPDELTRGLSNTPKLEDGHGMLFIMPSAARWGFWMKDMHYSLDILWLNANKTVIYIAANVAPITYPKVFAPTAPASDVIELPAGYAQKHAITVSSTAHFNL